MTRSNFSMSRPTRLLVGEKAQVAKQRLGRGLRSSNTHGTCWQSTISVLTTSTRLLDGFYLSTGPNHYTQGKRNIYPSRRLHAGLWVGEAILGQTESSHLVFWRQIAGRWAILPHRVQAVHAEAQLNIRGTRIAGSPVCSICKEPCLLETIYRVIQKAS